MLPIIALMRTYCDEFVNAQNPARCAQLMSNDYVLHLGGREYLGRGESYEPAVSSLFGQFPDLHVTIHEMLTDGDRLATRFTLQGSSMRHHGNKAAWGGVATYTWNGSHLTEVWVEEDYHLARKQLRSGRLEVPPQRSGLGDPWAVRALPPADGVEQAATAWLRPYGRIDALFASANRFAFHTSSPTVHLSGMATVNLDGSVSDVDVHSDGGDGDPRHSADGTT